MTDPSAFILAQYILTSALPMRADGQATGGPDTATVNGPVTLHALLWRLQGRGV